MNMTMRTPEELALSRAEWSIILDAMNGHHILRVRRRAP